MKRSTIFALATLVALNACAKAEDGDQAADGQTAANAEQAQDDLKDIGKYKLSMDKIDKYIQAQRNLGIAMSKMSPAEREAAEAESEAENANAEANNDPSIDGMTARIEKSKMMNDAIRDAGLSAREYTVITFAMMQASMALAIQKMRPNDNADSLAREMKTNPDNVKFFRENEAEITRKTTAVAEEMKKLGIEN